MKRPVKIIKAKDIQASVNTPPVPKAPRPIHWLKVAQAEVKRQRIAERVLFHQLFS